MHGDCTQKQINNEYTKATGNEWTQHNRDGGDCSKNAQSFGRDLNTTNSDHQAAYLSQGNGENENIDSTEKTATEQKAIQARKIKKIIDDITAYNSSPLGSIIWGKPLIFGCIDASGKTIQPPACMLCADAGEKTMELKVRPFVIEGSINQLSDTFLETYQNYHFKSSGDHVFFKISRCSPSNNILNFRLSSIWSSIKGGLSMRALLAYVQIMPPVSRPLAEINAAPEFNQWDITPACEYVNGPVGILSGLLNAVDRIKVEFSGCESNKSDTQLQVKSKRQEIRFTEIKEVLTEISLVTEDAPTQKPETRKQKPREQGEAQPLIASGGGAGKRKHYGSGHS